MDKDLIIELRNKAKENLEKAGNLAPVVFLEKRNGQITLNLLEYDNDLDKKISHAIIGNMLRSGEYRSFLHIAESFVVMTDEPEKQFLKIRPSEDKRRKEAITLMYKQDDGTGLMEIIVFEKQNGKFIFKEPISTEIKDDISNAGGAVWDMWR